MSSFKMSHIFIINEHYTQSINRTTVIPVKFNLRALAFPIAVAINRIPQTG